MNLEIPYTVKINELMDKLRDENPNAENFELKQLFENKYHCTVVIDKWFVNSIRFNSEYDLLLFLLKI